MTHSERTPYSSFNSNIFWIRMNFSEILYKSIAQSKKNRQTNLSTKPY